MGLMQFGMLIVNFFALRIFNYTTIYDKFEVYWIVWKLTEKWLSSASIKISIVDHTSWYSEHLLISKDPPPALSKGPLYDWCLLMLIKTTFPASFHTCSYEAVPYIDIVDRWSFQQQKKTSSLFGWPLPGRTVLLPLSPLPTYNYHDR